MKNMFFCCFIGSLFAAVRRLGETFPVFGRNASGVWAKRFRCLGETLPTFDTCNIYRYVF